MKCEKGLRLSVLKAVAAKDTEQQLLFLRYQSAVLSVSDIGQGLTTMAQTMAQWWHKQWHNGLTTMAQWPHNNSTNNGIMASQQWHKQWYDGLITMAQTMAQWPHNNGTNNGTMASQQWHNDLTTMAKSAKSWTDVCLSVPAVSWRGQNKDVRETG